MSTADASRVHLSSVAWDDPEVQRLAVAQQAELRSRYDGDVEPGTKPSAAYVVDPAAGDSLFFERGLT